MSSGFTRSPRRKQFVTQERGNSIKLVFLATDLRISLSNGQKYISWTNHPEQWHQTKLWHHFQVCLTEEVLVVASSWSGRSCEGLYLWGTPKGEGTVASQCSHCQQHPPFPENLDILEEEVLVWKKCVFIGVPQASPMLHLWRHSSEKSLLFSFMFP